MTLQERLDEREFYELMQAYRFAPVTDPHGIVSAFEAVKTHVCQLTADRIDALERENAALREQKAQALKALGEIAWSNDARWMTDRALEAVRAIDTAMAQHNGGQGGNIAGDGRNPLPGVAYAGQGWKR